MSEEVSKEPITVLRNPARRIAAALMSCFVPGSGEFLVGNRKRGAIHLSLLAAMMASYWPLRLPMHYWGLLILIYCLLLLWLVSPLTALRTKRCTYAPASWLWIFLILPFLYGGMNLAGWGMLRLSGFRAFQMPSESMSPTINKGDRLLADMWAYKSTAPRAGDIVIFRQRGIFLTKRVVAVAGDVVQGDLAGFTVNGQRPSEPYAVYDNLDRDPGEAFGPLTVPPGELFVVGDNRDHSYDSRIPGFAPVHLADVAGRPLYLYWSTPKGRERTPLQ